MRESLVICLASWLLLPRPFTSTRIDCSAAVPAYSGSDARANTILYVEIPQCTEGLFQNSSNAQSSHGGHHDFRLPFRRGMQLTWFSSCRSTNRSGCVTLNSAAEGWNSPGSMVLRH